VPHVMGIVISSAVMLSMFGVATRKSPKALSWFRLILWIAVVKILIVQLWLLAQGKIELASYFRAILINELIAIPLAVYWSRPTHSSYLSSLKCSADSAAA